MHIFTVLKVGCRASAYASDMLVCPTLQYAGPTRKQTLEHHERLFRESQVASAAPTISSTQQQLADWAQRKRVLEDKMKGSKLTRTDLQLLKGLERLGVVEHEPAVLAELDSMQRHGAVCCRLSSTFYPSLS